MKKYNTMKKLISIVACLFVLSSFVSANIPNEKVLKVFTESFAAPSEVKWFEGTDYFEVRFVESNVRSVVTYDKEGNFLRSLRYYDESKLPFYVSCKLKKKFADKKVYGVTEKVNEGVLTYYVKMESDTQWVTVKVDADGSMEVVEKYRKA